MNNKINIYWLIPIILVSGIFGFYTNTYSLFEFKYEIDIINLISLIVTTAIGFYIASSFQKNIEAQKFEKELNHRLIDSLIIKTKTLEKYLSTNSLKFRETIKLFKDLSSLISELKEINEICNVIEQSKITELRASFIIIKPLITGGIVTQNNLVLTTVNKGLSKTKLNTFRTDLIKIMLETNRK